MPIILPAFLSLVSFAIVVLTFYQKPHESFLALGLVALGIVLYILGAKWKNKPKEIQDKIGGYWILLLFLHTGQGTDIDKQNC